MALDRLPGWWSNIWSNIVENAILGHLVSVPRQTVAVHAWG